MGLTLFFDFKQFSDNLFWDEDDDASKEETDDVLTDANQGASKDAIEEDQNNSQNVSDQRKNSDTSDEVQSFRDRRQVKIIRVRISHSRDTRLIDFKIRVWLWIWFIGVSKAWLPGVIHYILVLTLYLTLSLPGWGLENRPLSETSK